MLERLWDGVYGNAIYRTFASIAKVRSVAVLTSTSHKTSMTLSSCSFQKQQNLIVFRTCRNVMNMTNICRVGGHSQEVENGQTAENSQFGVIPQTVGQPNHIVGFSLTLGLAEILKKL